MYTNPVDAALDEGTAVVVFYRKHSLARQQFSLTPSALKICFCLSYYYTSGPVWVIDDKDTFLSTQVRKDERVVDCKTEIKPTAFSREIHIDIKTLYKGLDELESEGFITRDKDNKYLITLNPDLYQLVFNVNKIPT